MDRQGNVVRGNFGKGDRIIFWKPDVEMGSGRTTLSGAGPWDWCAVVRDIGGGSVRLEIARWPRLDRSSGLLFDGVHQYVSPLRELQEVVDRARSRYDQPEPDRPLRMGDTFWIRSWQRPGKDLVEPGFQGLILDITDAAREQAMAALEGMVTGGFQEDN